MSCLRNKLQHVTMHCLLCCTRYFELVKLWLKPKCVAIHLKAIEQFFHAVPFIMLYKVLLTFKPVGKTVCG